jgi:nicotinamidase-related amidase
MDDPFEDHCWKDVVSPEALEVYAHYKRNTFVGKRPALLAIDLYNLVFYGGAKPVHEVARQHPSSCGIHAWNAIKPIQELFAICRSLDMPVVYTTTETRREVKPNSVYATNRQRLEFGAQDFEIKEEFKPQPKDLIVYKERASGFFGTPLIAHLTRLGVDSIIVCGETTSGCVRATTVDGYSFGFHMAVVEECCFDRHTLSHKINLFDLHHKYADVMHLEEARSHLEKARVRKAI